jgi:hypothetical protein
MADLQAIPTLIALHKDHVAISNTLWSINQVVSFAMLGYVFSQDHVRKSALLLTCLTVGFLLFVITNQGALARTYALTYTAATELKNAADKVEDPYLKPVLQAYYGTSPEDLRFGHSVLAALVLVGIWMPFIVARYRERHGAKPPTHDAVPEPDPTKK